MKRLICILALIAICAGCEAPSSARRATLLSDPPPASPLNDAVALFRAQAANPCPNEGTRDEGLALTNATFTEDAALGNHWVLTANSSGSCSLPASVLNGDVTFAARVRTNGWWVAHSIAMVVDNPGAAGEAKHFFAYMDTSNKYVLVSGIDSGGSGGQKASVF